MTKANKDGWKRVWGRACPAEAIGAIIDVRLRSGAIETNAPAHTWNWERTRHPLEVMAWRLHSIEEKQAPKFDPVALRDEVKSLRSAIVAHQAGISKITARIEEIEIDLDKEGFALVEKQALPDMDDPKNWRVGDVIECIDADIAPVGTKKTISEIEGGKIHRHDGGCVWIDAASEFWKFHSRP